MMKKILFILILFTISCGYEPIYLNKSSDKILFKKVTFIGDATINKKLTNSLLIKLDKSSKLNNEIIFESLIKKEEISKDTKGKVTSFRSTLSVNLKILENNQVVKSKDFLQTFTYANKDNKFELVEYQNKIENEILNKIIEEITLYFNLG